MTISILGCGWLGLPLAEALIADGHTVKGSTTSEDKLQQLSDRGIDPFLLELNPELNCQDCNTFWEADLLILNIPPGRGKKNVIDFHTSQVQAVIEQLRSSPISKVIFVSSTSVYPKLSGIVNEEDAVEGDASRDSGNALLKAEQLLMNGESFSTAVVRFGGLYGYDRHPAKYLAGRKELDKAKAPVNLIHRDDCIGIIQRIIGKGITREIFNAVSDGHPPRDIYYRAVAEELGLEPPTFKQAEPKDYKVVSNHKLKKKLGYTFRYPNPMNLKNTGT